MKSYLTLQNYYFYVNLFSSNFTMGIFADYIYYKRHRKTKSFKR